MKSENVLELLEQSAAQNPDKIVFADSVECISYQDLMQISKQTASFILHHNPQKENCRNRPVAILIDRNIRSLILFLGVAYSGNFYVPIDASMPKARIDLILKTLEPVMVINSREEQPWEDMLSEGMSLKGRKVFTYEQAVNEPADEQALQAARERFLDTDPLYAIFTSGSTGVPKGVVVSHKSVLDLTEQFGRTFRFPGEPVFGNQAPFDFDVSVKDIYNCLKLGGRMEVIPKQHFSFPVNLIHYLNERRINVLIWAVSALRIVSNFRTFSKEHPEFVELVMFSGEVMPVKALNYWMDELPEAQFVNLYGPTEITCNCSYYIVDRRFRKEENLPIGKAFRNCEVFLLSPEDNHLVTAAGELGEICVRGTCLALGYYNNPEKTAEAFVQNPLQQNYPERIYRTGDLGQYDEEGNLFFASRRDFQIKHMGHRIELGEIETAVNAMEFIDTACCVYDEKREKIVLCYQSGEACDKRIIEKLSKVLPKFMWPNRYVHYEQIPLNKNGKMDRVYLKSENCG